MERRNYNILQYLYNFGESLLGIETGKSFQSRRSLPYNFGESLLGIETKGSGFGSSAFIWFTILENPY